MANATKTRAGTSLATRSEARGSKIGFLQDNQDPLQPKPSSV